MPSPVGRTNIISLEIDKNDGHSDTSLSRGSTFVIWFLVVSSDRETNDVDEEKMCMNKPQVASQLVLIFPAGMLMSRLQYIRYYLHYI